MLVSTQDGIYIAVRHQHYVLKVTTERVDALKKLFVFIGGKITEFDDREFLYVGDDEWVAFLAAHTQDIQYTEYPPIPEQMFG